MAWGATVCVQLCIIFSQAKFAGAKMAYSGLKKSIGAECPLRVSNVLDTITPPPQLTLGKEFPDTQWGN